MKVFRASYFVPIALGLVWFATTSMADDADPNARSFWNWFQSHSTEFANALSYEKADADPDGFQKAATAIIDETKKQLQTNFPGFSPIFGSSNGKHEFIITVFGDAKKFSSVEAFIHSAPEISGWKFTALRPRREFEAGEEIQSSLTKFKLGDLRYAAAKQNGVFDFVVYFPMDVAKDTDGFRSLATRLVEDSLGEQLAATAIGNVNVAQIPQGSNTTLHPFVNIYADLSAQAK